MENINFTELNSIELSDIDGGAPKWVENFKDFTSGLVSGIKEGLRG